jgi:hypothetical protein
MESTYLQPGNARAQGASNRIATGYHWNKETPQYRGFQSRDCPEGQGAGSFLTSVNDFIRWAKALMQREAPINTRVYQGLLRLRSFPNPNARMLKPFTLPTMHAAGIEMYY